MTERSPAGPRSASGALRVLHLVGSAVSEDLADLSRLYARDALATLSAPGLAYAHVIAHVAPPADAEGGARWSFPTDLSSDAIAAAPQMPVAEALAHLAGLDVDVALPQMFCVPGMTTYRSLLDLLGIPFVGNTATVMAIGAHKQRARAVVAAAGVRVPDGELLRPGDPVTLSGDLVVKPASADNSAGIALVRSGAGRDAALADALQAAFAIDDEVLVEQFVPLGREVRCGVLERDGELVALPLEEYAVDADTKPVRDAADKLRRVGGDEAGAGELQLVAKDQTYAWIVDAGPEDAVVAAVHDLAREAFRALGCRHYGLFDVRIDPDGIPNFLEASLYCSYAQQSVLVAMGRAAGFDAAAMFADGVAAVRR